ncbi:DNA cytosine methyltransferase [Hafnia alvei]|uniref:DNA (cytosine-5-)-methyltransferase n=1 Tax=Hafnia alvei ATCC 51873 TaxID=1002364 RepID=G9YBF6_HAFAL|nr:DNA cytosine methyltransferase [Hafnia alvei]EHM39312.1 DNA (cytosine-5-)-methyltransferase [Hafnia alvei ATCC 51873]QQE44247.1 DNA cytosine methyltransferase [Hafnia alvei]
MKIKVFDFFSGCGGTSAGLKAAGFDIVFGLDIDNESAGTFTKNFSDAFFINDDIRNVDVNIIKDMVDTYKANSELVLFCGCAPCQPFSRQNNQKKTDDPRLNLLWEFGRFVETCQPDFVLVENVPGIQKLDVSSGPLLSFIELIKSNKYHSNHGVIPAIWYGVPQKRERFVLLASKKSIVELPEQTHDGETTPYSTVRDWISDLPPISAGETHPQIMDHAAPSLSALNIKRIKATPEGKGRESWPEELMLECHKNHNGHSDVYGRLAWDKPASGLTTRCISYSNGRFGHPEQNRALSVREAASLQTFPRDYLFHGSLSSKAKQIGNAVPPKMAEALGKAILKSITK